MDTKAKRAQYMREWRLRDIDGNREKERARRRANPERQREARRRFYLRHKAEIRAQCAEWRRRNLWRAKCSAKAAAANRRYPGTVTTDDVVGVFERGGNVCHHCGKTGLCGRDLTLEHLQPVNDVRCLVVSCGACNIARIQTRGPRKGKERLAKENRERVRAWQKANPDKLSARWRCRTPEQVQERRAYMRDYMRSRRAKERD